MENNNNELRIINSRKKSRREFIKSVGKLAVWIPPSLVILTHSKDALAAQSWNPGQGNQDHPGNGNGGPPWGAPKQ